MGSDAAGQRDALASIAGEIEEFAREWIGRIRTLIHRSGQLVERETLLAGALTRLDQQKAEWNRRTASKEKALREQAKRLTEAWLEIETERRKAIQASRAALVGNATGGHQVGVVPSGAGASGGADPSAAPGAATASVPPVTGSAAEVGPPVAVPPSGQANASRPPALPPSVSQSDAPHPGAAWPQPPLAAATDGGPQPARPPQVQSVPNAPVAVGHYPATDVHAPADRASRADSQKRQRIEEFRRMQRSIRTHRNT